MSIYKNRARQGRMRRLTKKDRDLRKRRNLRRGRTPAFIKAKLWEQKHVKRERIVKLPKHGAEFNPLKYLLKR